MGEDTKDIDHIEVKEYAVSRLCPIYGAGTIRLATTHAIPLAPCIGPSGDHIE